METIIETYLKIIKLNIVKCYKMYKNNDLTRSIFFNLIESYIDSVIFIILGANQECVQFRQKITIDPDLRKLCVLSEHMDDSSCQDDIVKALEKLAE
jgi:CRISPR/Cas system endoribonuclease Cas6 (RAMP superfamily)